MDSFIANDKGKYVDLRQLIPKLIPASLRPNPAVTDNFGMSPEALFLLYFALLVRLLQCIGYALLLFLFPLGTA